MIYVETALLEVCKLLNYVFQNGQLLAEKHDEVWRIIVLLPGNVNMNVELSSVAG